MWLFNQPPRQLLRERYQFDATDAWLAHLQRSSVRVTTAWGSASFVSGDGLLISNHHVMADALQKVSTKEKNYLRDGFYARTQAEEIKCPGLVLNVLQSTEDVTARVNAAVPKDASADAASEARRKVIAEIEKESRDRTGLRSSVITFWEGGAYILNCYQRFTDARIVFAPEYQTANFGGDADNWEYPSYALDICFFRVYENNQPVKVKDFLKFSPVGTREGDLVFISGHPLSSSRSLTVADLELRRKMISSELGFDKQKEVLLVNWSARSEENARRAKVDLDAFQNERKLEDGRYAGLLDPELIAAKAKAEDDFKARLAGKPEFAEALAAYDKIEAHDQNAWAQYQHRQLILGFGFDCASIGIARSLLIVSPSGEPLPKFPDPRYKGLERVLFADDPIYPDYEILKLANSLTFMVGQLGLDDPLVQKILAGKSPRARAAELINGTQVRDLAFRKRLYEGGASAVAAANDSLIEVARAVDAESRALRKISDSQDEIMNQAKAAIDRATFALDGTAGYPEASFTLRLAFGTVKGYEEDGHPVPVATTFAGLYDRAKEMKNRPPYDLPTLWTKRKSHLNLSLPFNSVSTCDIIGGNSGSPVVNRAGEFVGIIFDTNLQALPWDYMFNDKQGRAVEVESAAILEALDKVYRAKALVRELLTGRRNK
jgi:hypothetical protein